ncbi:MAG: aldehyde dehydrogenase [Bdellovibrionota bacterium]
MSALDPSRETRPQFVALLEAQRRFFAAGHTRSLKFRDRQLEFLENLVLSNERKISEALRDDLGKPEQESFVTEIAMVLSEIRHARKNLKKWMAARRVSTSLVLFPATSRIYREPVGVALVIAPWNYPFMLALSPLIGAIAAGCCAILKPSEVSSKTSKLLHELLTSAFPPDFVTVVEGGVPETTALLNLRFDHIFFTGSTAVGRIVALAAANHLTPTTLELGGKSPAIVCADADLEVAARRIVWGRFMNGGQTCVAPDYLYVNETIAEKFLSRMRHHLQEFYGKNPALSCDYARIVSHSHFDRLERILEKSAAKSEVDIGGAHDRSSKYIAPTILKNVDWTSPSMQDEIFGPILPVMTYSRIDDVFTKLATTEKPLAAYIFTENKFVQDKFIELVPFGGGCINDTVSHLGSANLPFGGVGGSGYGSYHGEKSFLAFTHEKSVLKKSRRLDLSVRYPPYKPWKMKFLRLLFLGRWG